MEETRTGGAGLTGTDIKDRALSLAESQKERIAKRVAAASNAWQNIGRELRDGGDAETAAFADRMSARVAKVERYLAEHDVTDMAESAKGLARREPLLFFGAAFACGVLAARFFRGMRFGSGATSGVTTAAQPTLEPEPRIDAGNGHRTPGYGGYHVDS
jgi:hypothetical protein